MGKQVLLIVVVLLGAVILFPARTAALGGAGVSQWVYFGPGGKLAYRSLPTGDRIMDFSCAGYGGGGVAIPDVPVRMTVSPSGGDDTAAIQQSIDAVSAMVPVDGFRGAVLLRSGTFQCSQPLVIAAGGVVLRGTSGAILSLVGSPHVAINVRGQRSVTEVGSGIPIIDSYVPSGSDTFSVSSAAGLSAGDSIEISRPVTPAWLQFMGMSDLVRSGKKQRWLNGTLRTVRTIRRVVGNRIMLDVPLSDSYDATYLNPPGATVEKVNVSGVVDHVGIEHLQIDCPPQAIEISAPQYRALDLDDVTDCWVRDLDIVDTIDSIGIGDGSSRVTVQRVNIKHTVATLGAAKPGDFGDNGTQVLFDRCTDDGDNLFYCATFGRTQCPNVALNCVFRGNGHIQPHMRWSTGFLVDNCQTPSGGIDLMNRGIMGSGHGWTMGWGVAWNCVAKTYTIQQPPGSMNWAIGCIGAPQDESMPGTTGPKLPNGEFESPGVPVKPASLYLEQLRERLGDQAISNIGY